MFKNTPGFLAIDSAFKRVLLNCNNIRQGTECLIKGALYELRTARGLLQSGEKIIEFGRSIPNSEIDILTEKYAIECKSVFWDAVPKLIKYTNKFTEQSTEVAKQVIQQYIIYTQHAPTEELKEFSIKNGITYLRVK